jgi:hypothetical protein
MIKILIPTIILLTLGLCACLNQNLVANEVTIYTKINIPYTDSELRSPPPFGHTTSFIFILPSPPPNGKGNGVNVCFVLVSYYFSKLGIYKEQLDKHLRENIEIILNNRILDLAKDYSTYLYLNIVGDLSLYDDDGNIVGGSPPLISFCINERLPVGNYTMEVKVRDLDNIFHISSWDFEIIDVPNYPENTDQQPVDNQANEVTVYTKMNNQQPIEGVVPFEQRETFTFVSNLVPPPKSARKYEGVCFSFSYDYFAKEGFFEEYLIEQFDKTFEIILNDNLLNIGDYEVTNVVAPDSQLYDDNGNGIGSPPSPPRYCMKEPLLVGNYTMEVRVRDLDNILHINSWDFEIVDEE